MTWDFAYKSNEKKILKINQTQESHIQMLLDS